MDAWESGQLTARPEAHNHGALRLHAMPDRRKTSKKDRLAQKWWVMRARVAMALRPRP